MQHPETSRKVGDANTNKSTNRQSLPEKVLYRLNSANQQRTDDTASLGRSNRAGGPLIELRALTP